MESIYDRMNDTVEPLLKDASIEDQQSKVKECMCTQHCRWPPRNWITLVAFLTLGAVALFSTITLSLNTLFSQYSEKTLIANSVVPKFPFRPTYIQHNVSYLGVSEEAESLWEHILPAGAGYFTVKDPRHYGLPPSKPVENSTQAEEIYILSVAHQLHCLGAVRAVVLAHERGDPPYDDGGHARHCLEKIREALICFADTTTEVGYPEANDAGEIVGWNVDDYEVTHQCRDWGAVRSWVYEHRLNNKRGLKVI